jgi:hypothetical protein
MDAYIDNELLVETNVDVLQHIQECRPCADELNARTALRNRVRAAGQTEMVTPEFRVRVQQAVREEARPKRSRLWVQSVMAIAATGIAGVLISYQLGYLRWTAQSREAFISSISQRVSYTMRIGLGDHVHCAVFRKYPKEIPSAEQMTHDLGPEYKDLLPIVRNAVPNEYTIVMAHQCQYHGRHFVHVALRGRSGLASLVITKRSEGEAFTRDTLVPALAHSNPALYQASVSRFALNSFETRAHLVYFISDLGAKRNVEMLTAMAGRVEEFLRRLES